MDENEMRIVSFDRICRLCLSEKRILMEIFESSADTNNLYKDDGFPTRICIKCLSNVNAAFEFRSQCENADKTLHSIHNLLVANETDLKNELEVEETEYKLGKKGKDGSQPGKMIGDLSHIIVIKKPDKESEKTEKEEEEEEEEELVKESNQIYSTNNERKLRNGEEGESIGVFEDEILCNQGEFTLSSVSDTLSCQVEEPSEVCNTANEISFVVQEGEQETYKVIINPSENAEVGEVRVRDKNKGKGDVSKSPCPFCNKMLTRVDEHIRLLHRNRVYICTKTGCGAEFLTLKNLQSHQLRCYNMKKAYKCLRCSKEFHRKSNFKAHVRRHGSKKEYQCQLCERAFVDTTGLRRHFLKHHEPEQEIFISGCCGKRFKSKEGLKKHIQNGTCGIHIFQVGDLSNQAEDGMESESFYATNDCISMDKTNKWNLISINSTKA